MNVLFFYTEILVFIGESLFFNNDLHEIELSLLSEDKRMLGKNKEACRLLKIAKRVKIKRKTSCLLKMAHSFII